MSDSENTQRLRELGSSIASLQSGKYSDFTIRCSDDTIIHAHRAVVCPRSRVLSAMLDGKFQEATTKEAYLEDDEPEIVKKLMEFLYTTDYNDGRLDRALDSSREMDCPIPIAKDESEEGDSEEDEDSDISLTEKRAGRMRSSIVYNPQSLVTNAKMYIIADKYEIETLKKLASSKYEQVVSKHWNSTALSESARLIFDNTIESDRSIKDVIVQAASDNISALLDRGEFTELLKSEGDLATSILKRIVDCKESTSGFNFAGLYTGRVPIRGKRKNKKSPFY